MATRQEGSRSTATQRRAQLRSKALAGRLGAGLREARLASGRRQREVSVEAGLSQPRYSELERGLGASASLATWTSAAEAVGEELVAFLEHVPGAARPRDYEHLKRQVLIVRTAIRGGWQPKPESPIHAMSMRSRSVDVFLTRDNRHEVAAVEIWDWFNDVGDAMRGFDGKIAAIRRGVEADRGDSWRVSGLWVVRGTRRNRDLVGELRELFASKFPGSAGAWLVALENPATPMPLLPGLVWTDVRGARLIPARWSRRSGTS
jgi:transcriptional regulator with XRE-family HTH domain